MTETPADKLFPAAQVHELPVKTKIVVAKGKIESEGFIEEVKKFLSGGKHVWRSSGKVATHFTVDPVELHNFLSKCDDIVSKCSDEKEVFYALKSRSEDKPEKPRPVITEEDRYALAQLSLAHDMVHQVLKRFGVTIHIKCPEAFGYFVEGRSKLEIGLVHLATATKANLEKLE